MQQNLQLQLDVESLALEFYTLKANRDNVCPSHTSLTESIEQYIATLRIHCSELEKQVTRQHRIIDELVTQLTQRALQSNPVSPSSSTSINNHKHSNFEFIQHEASEICEWIDNYHGSKERPKRRYTRSNSGN
jgi:hypothetical protein